MHVVMSMRVVHLLGLPLTVDPGKVSNAKFDQISDAIAIH
jgi:hypothetical protein